MSWAMLPSPGGGEEPRRGSRPGADEAGPAGGWTGQAGGLPAPSPSGERQPPWPRAHSRRQQVRRAAIGGCCGRLAGRGAAAAGSLPASGSPGWPCRTGARGRRGQGGGGRVGAAPPCRWCRLRRANPRARGRGAAGRGRRSGGSSSAPGAGCCGRGLCVSPTWGFPAP